MPHRLRHLPALLGAVLLFGALYAVQQEFRSLQLDAIAVYGRRATGEKYLINPNLGTAT